MRYYSMDCYKNGGYDLSIKVDSRRDIKENISVLLDRYDMIVSKENNKVLAIYANTKNYGKLKCVKIVGNS